MKKINWTSFPTMTIIGITVTCLCVFIAQNHAPIEIAAQKEYAHRLSRVSPTYSEEEEFYLFIGTTGILVSLAIGSYTAFYANKVVLGFILGICTLVAVGYFWYTI